MYIYIYISLSSIPLSIYIYTHTHIHIAHVFFIHSSVDGHLAWLHIMAIANNTDEY